MVVAIMGFITMVMLVRQQQFDSSTLLRSLAYSVALTARQAQTYGTSVHAFGSGGAATFAPAYGVYISQDLSCLSGIVDSCYILFADNNGDGQRAADASEDVQTFNMSKGFVIKDFCAIVGGLGSIPDCHSAGMSWMTIVYRRPNPDACFATSLYPDACAGGALAHYNGGATVQVSAQAGSARSINLSTTGEIGVGANGT
jgi:hypothetical protein